MIVLCASLPPTYRLLSNSRLSLRVDFVLPLSQEEEEQQQEQEQEQPLTKIYQKGVY